ncbi:MAG: hypothetical protein V1809_04125 [Planctomycetota bacterium]
MMERVLIHLRRYGIPVLLGVLLLAWGVCVLRYYSEVDRIRQMGKTLANQAESVRRHLADTETGTVEPLPQAEWPRLIRRLWNDDIREPASVAAWTFFPNPNPTDVEKVRKTLPVEPPEGIAAEAEIGVVTLTFRDNPASKAPLVNYRVERKDTNTGDYEKRGEAVPATAGPGKVPDVTPAPAAASGWMFVDKGLASKTRYDYRVVTVGRKVVVDDSKGAGVPPPSPAGDGPVETVESQAVEISAETPYDFQIVFSQADIDMTWGSFYVYKYYQGGEKPPAVKSYSKVMPGQEIGDISNGSVWENGSLRKDLNPRNVNFRTGHKLRMIKKGEKDVVYTVWENRTTAEGGQEKVAVEKTKKAETEIAVLEDPEGKEVEFVKESPAPHLKKAALTTGLKSGPVKPEEKEFYTPREVQDELKIDDTRFQRLMKQERIRPVPRGGEFFLRKGDVETIRRALRDEVEKKKRLEEELEREKGTVR